MWITEAGAGNKKKAIIRLVEDEDFMRLVKQRYFFSWRPLKGKAALYKLCIAGEEDILGIMALLDVPEEKRVEIKLLASSKENVGSGKIYEGIAGCLIAYACRESVKKYDEKACVSLVPKTALRQKYIKKYGMMDAGRQLFIEGKALIDLIIKYLS